MSDNAKAPTVTSPLGNTAMRPSVCERGVGENVAAKLRRDHPEQNKRMCEHLAKKKRKAVTPAADECAMRELEVKPIAMTNEAAHGR